MTLYLVYFNRYGSKRLKDTLGLYRGLSAGLFLTGQRYFLESERLAVSPCFQSLWETYVTYCFLFFLTKSESGISLSPSFTNFMYSFNIRLSKRKLWLHGKHLDVGSSTVDLKKKKERKKEKKMECSYASHRRLHMNISCEQFSQKADCYSRIVWLEYMFSRLQRLN